MKKNILLSLFAVVFVAATMLTGCSQLTSLLNISGTLPTPSTVVSGVATKSGDVVTIKLNSILGATGEALTGLVTGEFKIKVGSGGDVSGFTDVTGFTVVPSTTSKIDMVFIFDNTGSMSSRIIAVKNSIATFATNLAAGGADVKFGCVSFGDNAAEQSTLALPATAAQVSTWLNALTGVGGGDGPENPLDSIMHAYDNYTWRSDAQKVFVVITDIVAHQKDDGTTFTTRKLAEVQRTLYGKASVYAVSPKLDSGSTAPMYSSYTGTADIRWLADGKGWFSGVTSGTYATLKGSDGTTTYTGTGGKWIELPSSGDIDLTTLGISTTVTKGYKIIFTRAGSFNIYIQIDTNSDGTFDSDGFLEITLGTSSMGKWLSDGQLSDPSEGTLGTKN